MKPSDQTKEIPRTLAQNTQYNRELEGRLTKAQLPRRKITSAEGATGSGRDSLVLLGQRCETSLGRAKGRSLPQESSQAAGPGMRAGKGRAQNRGEDSRSQGRGELGSASDHTGGAWLPEPPSPAPAALGARPGLRRPSEPPRPRPRPFATTGPQRTARH